MLHVHAYLMGTTRLQTTFHQRHIREALQYAPMGNRLFGLRTVFGVPYAVERTVFVIACQSTFDRTAVFFESTPYQGVIGALGRMIEELLSQMRLRFGGLGDKQQT